MKYIKFLMMMFAAAVVFVGCETDIERPQILPEEEFTVPVLSPIGDIAVSPYTINETVIFTCTPVYFGQPVTVRYELMLTNAAGDKEARLLTSYSPTMSVSKSDINGLAMNKLDVPGNDSGILGAYVVAYVGDSDICTPKSESISFRVSTYKAALRIYYMCGYFVNNWAIDNAVSMWETASGTNVYEGMYHITADPGNGLAGFKVMPGRAWSDDKGYSAFASLSSNFTSSDDGNLVLPEGIWQISLDLSAMSISATSVSKVSAVGEWGWEDDIDFTYDPVANVWTSTKTISGQFKIRLNGSWDINYGSSMKAAENMPEGESEAFELVSDGDNINLGSPCYVKLYADRTPWVVAFE